MILIFAKLNFEQQFISLSVALLQSTMYLKESRLNSRLHGYMWGSYNSLKIQMFNFNNDNYSYHRSQISLFENYWPKFNCQVLYLINIWILQLRIMCVHRNYVRNVSGIRDLQLLTVTWPAKPAARCNRADPLRSWMFLLKQHIMLNSSTNLAYAATCNTVQILAFQNEVFIWYCVSDSSNFNINCQQSFCTFD